MCVDREFFGPEAYERFRRECEAKRAHQARLNALREARLARGGAMSNAERQRAFVARTNELPPLPAVADLEGRESCRFDFVKFVHRYGAALLKEHMPSPMMIQRFLKPLQDSVLNGGQMIIEMPRGKGKTTFLELLSAWALAFGHRHYVVLISATGKLAAANLRNIMKFITSPAFAADFPEVAFPFQQLHGKWQLCESQTFNGERTGVEMKTDRVKFAALKDADGNEIGEAAGGVIVSCGVGGAVRGLNEGGIRPDMIFFDDIQKRKDAKSPRLSESLEEFVNQDAMGLFGHGAARTAVMALTPICEGDFVSLMTDADRNPAWVTVKVPLVVEWPANMELVDTFLAVYKDDCAHDDFARTNSRRFYEEHREELNKGCVLLDPLDGAAGEIDALHHVLLIRATVGKEAFEAEYQMNVREEGISLTITPDIVKHALNGAPRLTLPAGTEIAVGFCDVNAQDYSGLRYGLIAFGTGRVLGVMEINKYPPGKKALFDESLPEAKRPEVIAQAVRFVGNLIAALPVKYANGRAAQVAAFAFDGGNWTAAVARACLLLQKVDRVPFRVFWTLGRGWRNFGSIAKSKVLRRGDHMYETRSANGKHIVFHADYWREIGQSLFLSEPLTPGSCSLYGSDPYFWDEFASEVCAERLVRKFVTPEGKLRWDWDKRSKRNHWGDVVTGCLVVASWIRAYENDERVIDRAALKVLPSVGAARVKPAAGASEEEPKANSGLTVFRAPLGLARKRKKRFSVRTRIK